MLLDTSGLLCFHHAAEPQHDAAVTFLQSAPLCITHSYVLAEFVALAAARRLPRQAALRFVAELQDNPLVEVVYVDEVLHREAFELLQQRLDKAWTLCDAVSFVLMRQRGIAEALTTDSHFRTGWLQAFAASLTQQRSTLQAARARGVGQGGGDGPAGRRGVAESSGEERICHYCHPRREGAL